MQTKHQRITCKYITYCQKSKEAELAFNYLINRSTDTKGLCHMVSPPSVFCSNDYYTADKNYISLYLSAFPSTWNAPPSPSPFYSAFWLPARSRTNATSSRVPPVLPPGNEFLSSDFWDQLLCYLSQMWGGQCEEFSIQSVAVWILK